MRTADLHNICHLLGLAIQSLMQLAKPWEGYLYDLLVAGDMHPRGEGIIGGLRLIDVVVG